MYCRKGHFPRKPEAFHQLLYSLQECSSFGSFVQIYEKCHELEQVERFFFLSCLVCRSSKRRQCIKVLNRLIFITRPNFSMPSPSVPQSSTRFCRFPLYAPARYSNPMKALISITSVNLMSLSLEYLFLIMYGYSNNQQQS